MEAESPTQVAPEDPGEESDEPLHVVFPNFLIRDDQERSEGERDLKVEPCAARRRAHDQKANRMELKDDSCPKSVKEDTSVRGSKDR